MAESSAAVTDTHALLFHAAGGTRLGSRARVHFQSSEAGTAITYVPVAVMWECSLLARAGRVVLRRSVRAFFDDLFTSPAYQPWPISKGQVLDADELGFTRDPFDGLIVAAARDLGLPLLTRDRTIHDAGVVETVW